MEEFKVGDVVYLKDGSSAAMTLDDLGDETGMLKALCVWHDKNHKPQSQRYSLESLTKENPNKPLGIYKA